MCCAIRIGSRNKIIAGASASVMNAPVQNAFAFALGFYQSALHLCESKSREPTERRTEPTGWVVRFDTTDVRRRRVASAPTRWFVRVKLGARR